MSSELRRGLSIPHNPTLGGAQVFPVSGGETKSPSSCVICQRVFSQKGPEEESNPRVLLQRSAFRPAPYPAPFDKLLIDLGHTLSDKSPVLEVHVSLSSLGCLFHRCSPRPCCVSMQFRCWGLGQQ